MIDTAARQASAGDKLYWETHATHYDGSVRLLSRRIPRMLELVCGGATGATRALEVAAGTGLVTMALATVVGELVATDYADAMVATLRQRVVTSDLDNVFCEHADLYSLPYAPATFDVVVAANVLHLVPDIELALEALRVVLKPGGRLIVPTFCHDESSISRVTSRLLAIRGFPVHRRFTSATLCSILESCGLQVERFEVLSGLIPIGYVHGSFSRIGGAR